MSTAWDTARRGSGAVLLLRGEAGIGKTRLVVELSRTVAAHRGHCLYARCDEEPLTPYQPITDALRQLPSFAPDTLDAAVADAELSPDAARRRVFAAVMALLHAAADVAPVLLVIDDAHLADAATLRLLRHIAETSVDRPLLVLVAYCDAEVDRRQPLAELITSLHRRCAVVDIALSGMSRQEVADLALMSMNEALPAAALAAVHWATAGNPLFVEELLRAVVDAAEAGGRSWDIATVIEAVGVPDGIAAVIGRRLLRLGECCNHLLQMAAVIGQEFDVAALDAVCATDAEKVVGCLESAMRARLVVEMPGCDGRFAFYHPLVRVALLDSITRARRALVHRRIAAALVTLPAPPDAATNDGGAHREATAHLRRALGTTGLEASTAAPVQPSLAGGLYRNGEFWTAVAGSDAARLRDSIGLRYIAELLRSPGREIHALDLVTAVCSERRGAPGMPLAVALAVQAGLGPESNVSAFPDREARAAYKRRLDDLAAELAEAEGTNDPERATRCRLERDLLTEELTRGIGLGGRERPGNGACERARSSVTKAIRNSLDRLTATSPRLGYALDSAIRTGMFCIFDPGPAPAIVWSA